MKIVRRICKLLAQNFQFLAQNSDNPSYSSTTLFCDFCGLYNVNTATENYLIPYYRPCTTSLLAGPGCTIESTLTRGVYTTKYVKHGPACT